MRPARLRLAVVAAAAVVLVPAAIAAQAIAPFERLGDVYRNQTNTVHQRVGKLPAHAPYVSGPRIRAKHDPAGILRGVPIHGMILEGPTAAPTKDLPDFPRLKSIGVNTIEINIYTYANSVKSNTVRPTLETMSDAELANLANIAHSEGFAVEFSPIVWIGNPYQWRGEMAPTDIGAFFRSYTSMVTRYAALAQKLDVELFAIGSEMNSLQNYETKWRTVARSVDRVYNNLTTYMGTCNAGLKIAWWDAVDLISLSSYYSLTNKLNPSESELYYVWMNNIMPSLLNLSNKFHRPVFFNEAGYASVVGNTINPSIADRQTELSVVGGQEAQATAYRAMLRASHRASWFRGLILFHWRTPGEEADRSFSIRDKLAECEVANDWAPAQALNPLASRRGASSTCTA